MGPADYPVNAEFQSYVPPVSPGGRGTWVPVAKRWLRMEPKRGEFQEPSSQNKTFYRAFTPLPRKAESLEGQIDISLRFKARGKTFSISFVAIDMETSEIVIDCVTSRSGDVL